MAPKERSLIKLFSQRGDVIFGDISPEQYPGVDVSTIDLMDMSALGQFDIFYASHVMEHVPDDRKVFRNVFERLRSGGEAWILVPLHEMRTVDGSPDMSPRQRERLFGQWDHLRQYGVDIVDRMRAAGFETSIIGIDSFAPAEIHRFGLSSGDKIFVGRK